MFKFQAKFLQKPTTATTIRLDVPTGDAMKTTTTTDNHQHSRLLQERQSKKCTYKPQNRTLAAGMPRL
jgi:hypothetical protein